MNRTVKHEIRNENGFTLIELMIVVAIIAILATIALPSYQRYVMQSHRVDARNTLLDIAQKMQQQYSVHRKYDDKTDLSDWGQNKSPATGTTRYNISFVSTNFSEKKNNKGEVVVPYGFILQAVPTGPQKKDKCGTFTLNQSGVKTAGNGGKAYESRESASKANSRSDLSAECWSK